MCIKSNSNYLYFDTTFFILFKLRSPMKKERKKIKKKKRIEFNSKQKQQQKNQNTHHNIIFLNILTSIIFYALYFKRIKNTIDFHRIITPNEMKKKNCIFKRKFQEKWDKRERKRDVEEISDRSEMGMNTLFCGFTFQFGRLH